MHGTAFGARVCAGRPPLSNPHPLVKFAFMSHGGAGVTVLVVDDYYTSRYLLHTVLEYRGYHSVEARTAALALGMLADVQPAVMVCDVVMPDMDGYQLARQMKTDEATAAVPVIFYTSTYPSLGARPTAEQLQLGPVVAKTGDLDALIDAVEHMLHPVPHDRPRQPSDRPGR